MSMIAYLQALTPDEIKKFQQQPSSVAVFLRASQAARTKQNVSALRNNFQQLRATIGKMAASKDLTAQNEAIRREMEKAGVVFDNVEDNLNLDKSWHILHYLLTGSEKKAPPPLGNAILGGMEIGDDLGHGPARFLTTGEVREVAAALRGISMDSLVNRLDLNAMLAANIYACKSKSDLELTKEFFERFVQYYFTAASKGNAMLLYIM